jgi:WD40 repeat protein
VRIRSACFDRDGEVVILAQEDGAASIWQVEAGLRLLSLRGHGGAVTAALFLPAGRRALTTSVDGTVAVWDADGTAHRFAGHDGAAMCAAASPVGARVVSGGDDRLVRVWDARTGAEEARLAAHRATVLAVAIDAEASVVSGDEDGVLELWDPDGEVDAEVEIDGTIWNVAIAPSGDRLLFAGGLDAYLWAPGEPPRAIRPEGGPIYGVAWAPDGRIAVSAGAAVTILDPSGERELARFEGHEAAINHVAFGAAGRYLVSASDDGSAIVWGSGAGQLVRRLTPE